MRRLSLGLMFGRRGSLAFRFTLLTGVALVVVSAASGYVGARAERDALLDGLQQQVERLAELLAANSADPLFSFAYPRLEATVQAFVKDPVVRRVEVKDKDGKTVIATGEEASREPTVVATREVKAGGEIVGSVLVALSTESVDRAVVAAYRLLAIREVIALLLLWAVLVYLARRLVVRPLLAVVARLDERARGDADLTLRLAVGSSDEVGRLGRALNTFLDRLHGLVAQIRETAVHVGGASKQLSAASEQLSGRAQEQASALEETAASLEQITGAIKQSADNAQQANRLAVGSRATAEKGGQVVDSAVAAMGEIALIEEDCRDHHRHRRDRIPDEPPGPERGRRGGAGGGAGARLRGGGGRGAEPRPAERGGGQGDQGAHRRLGAAGRGRVGAGEPLGAHAHGDRGIGQARHRHHRGRSRRPVRSRRRAPTR